MKIVTEREKEVLKRAAVKHFIEHGINTEDELWFVVKHCLGINIPREVCCEDHQPMWEALKDDFFHRVRKQAMQHCRGGGKTFQVGLTKSLKFIFLPGIRISNFAATENQGKALQRYKTDFLGPAALPEVQATVAELGLTAAEGVPRKVPGRDKKHGSVFTGLIGTLKGVNSSHVDDLVVDERAQMEDAVFREAMGMMTARAPYPGILTVLSTVKAKGDAMDTLMEHGPSLGYKTYISCVLDVTTCKEPNCDGCKKTIAYTDDKRESASFFDFCRGRILGKELGHFSVATARDKFTEMGLTNAKAQLFCLEPDGEERAFPGFSFSKHVVSPEKVIIHKRWATADGDFYIFGDFGKSDHSAFIKAYELPHGGIYLDDELIGNGKTIEVWIELLREKGWLNPGQIYIVDPAGRQTTIVSNKSAIEHLEEAGAHVIASRMDELTTTEHLRDQINADPPKLLINPRCKKTIEAFNRASNDSIGRGDDKIYKKVIKHNKFSHPIDSVRYGVNTVLPDHGEIAQHYTKKGR